MDSDEDSDSFESDTDSLPADEIKESTIHYILSFPVPDNLRQVFVLILIVGNFLSINCGVIFILLGVYIKSSLEKQLTFLQDYYHPNVVPVALFISGVVMLLSSVVGVKAAIGGRIIEDITEAKSAALFFLIYFVSAAITAGLIFITACVCVGEIRVLQKALGEGLKAGMGKYTVNRDVKSDIDLLQIDYRCCGVVDYKDWYDVSWIDVKYLDKNDPGISKMLKRGKYFGKDVPFSCCRRDIYRPCVDARIEDTTYHSMYSYPTDLTLHANGCREAVMDFLGHSVFLGVGLYVYFCLIVWILMTIIARYLHTSVVQLSLGEPPVGWLIPYVKGEKKLNQSPVKSSESVSDEALIWKDEDDDFN